jgi:hypothetical protein
MRRRLAIWAGYGAWALTLAAGVVALAGVFSMLYWTRHLALSAPFGTLRLIDLSHGVLWVEERRYSAGLSRALPPEWTVVRMPSWGWGFGPNDGGSRTLLEWCVGVRYRPLPYGYDLGLNLLTPLVLTALPAAALWYLARRRAGPGRCRKCGYDRAGLEALSKCPECGTVPAPQAQS